MEKEKKTKRRGKKNGNFLFHTDKVISKQNIGYC